MNIDPIWVIVAVAVVVLVVVLVAVLLGRRRKRREHLRGRFGPEYGRTVERTDSRSKAESDLAERERRHDERDLRSLDTDERERYLSTWDEIQLQFVEAPALAIERGDALLREVMRARRYPDNDEVDRRADDLSVDHPERVERYREAHRKLARADGRDPSTEDRRDALLLIRSLFDAVAEAPQVRERRVRRHADGTLADTSSEPQGATSGAVSAGQPPTEAAPPGQRPGDPLPPPPKAPTPPPGEETSA